MWFRVGKDAGKKEEIKLWKQRARQKRKEKPTRNEKKKYMLETNSLSVARAQNDQRGQGTTDGNI